MSSMRVGLETIGTGFALFSMLFGAGNVVYPIILGEQTREMVPMALLGFLTTGVLIPFMGLITLFLFKGDYNAFFRQTGKVPAFLCIATIVAIIGPFGALPRCIALTFSTLQLHFPDLNVYLFTALSCGVVAFFAFSESQIIHVLGYVLTPILLITLASIISVGLFVDSILPVETVYTFSAFLDGLQTGYRTMDLPGTIFFSSVVMASLMTTFEGQKNARGSFIGLSLKASAIAGGLLAFVYIGFCLLASGFAPHLQGVPSERALGLISAQVLGGYGGIFTSVAVSLACLTTAIALAAVSARFIEIDLLPNRLSYHTALIITMVISFCVAIMEFDGINRLLTPILVLIYPSLIALTCASLLNNLWGFKWVKEVVYATFVLTCLVQWFT